MSETKKPDSNPDRSPYVDRLSIDEYVKQRLFFRMEEYRTKATKCRDTHLYLSITGIICSSAVPIIINVGDSHLCPETFKHVVTTIISFVVVVCVALENVYHFRERWKNYQQAEESLRREKYLVETRMEYYLGLSDEKVYETLVKNVESIIKSERDSTINVRSAEIKK